MEGWPRDGLKSWGGRGGTWGGRGGTWGGIRNMKIGKYRDKKVKGRLSIRINNR